jgi:PhnB protein
MKLTPCIELSFNGTCEAAFRCYERCLDGTITFMLTWGKSPSAAEAPADWSDKIYHATIRVGDLVIMGGDQPPDRYDQPKGFALVLPLNDVLAAERVFQVLAEGGTIKLPLQQTFWASRFGVLVDRFGIRWTINCEQPSPAEDEQSSPSLI